MNTPMKFLIADILLLAAGLWLASHLAGCGPPRVRNALQQPTITGEIVTEESNTECPNRSLPVGFREGDVFPSVQFPNAEWDPVNIKSLCGSKAVLVITGAEWCGSCLVEFDYLAMVAPDWKERGVEVYYTLFENGAGQPASTTILQQFELYMMDIYGSVPFRVLADPSSSLVRAMNGRVTLPLVWVLDSGMIVRQNIQGANAEDYLPIINSLL